MSTKIIDINVGQLKSELDKVREGLDLGQGITDERLLECLVGNLIDRYFSVEYFNREDIINSLS